MFFNLTTSTQDNFPNQYPLGNFVLNTDAGWKVYSDYESTSVFKGYTEGCNIEDVVKSHTSGYSGNFCIFTYWNDTGNIEITTDKLRSFIMWYDSESLTNLEKLENTIWVDGDVVIDRNFSVTETKKDVIGKIDTSTISVDEFLDFAYDRLYNKTKAFLEYNTLPVKAFLSGGLDSMLVYSFVTKITNEYEHVFENVVQWDQFWCSNDKTIKRNFWGYNQIHHWTDPCVLTSGAPGDEFMFRNPHMNKLWAAHKSVDINDFLHDNYRYSQRLYYDKYVNDVVDTTEIEELNDEQFARVLCNQVVNDCQHWHIGNTLTFTPLRDIEIFKQMLRLSPEDLGSQIGGGELSIRLIERNDPELMDYVSKVKNVASSLQNIPKLMKKVTKNGMAL